jgi:hypothetical protein
MEDKDIVKTSEIVLGENYQLRVLAYSDSGTGGTWIIRTLPKPVFVIDTDMGAITNRGIDGIDVVEIAPDRLVKGTYAKSWDAVKGAMDWFEKNKEKYRSLVWDSLTTIADAALANLMWMNRHQITGSKDDQGASLPDLNMEKQLVVDQLMRAISMGRHFYCRCHQEVVKTELGVQMVMPAARGQLQGKIGKWFDEVYYLYLKSDPKDGNKIKGYMKVKSDSPLYMCKSRLGNRAEIDAEQLADLTGYAKLCGVELK